MSQSFRDFYTQCAEERDEDMFPQAATIRVGVDIDADLSFSDVLEALQEGHRVTRDGWDGAFIELFEGDDEVARHIRIGSDDSDIRAPWLPATGELFANDWAAIPL